MITTSRDVPATDADTTQTFDDPPRLTFQSEFSVVEAIGYALLWFILGIVTLGLAFFVFPYYAEKHVLNNIFVTNRKGERVGRLACDVNLGQAIGHAIVWLLLTVITFGVAGVIYAFVLTAYTMKHTHIEPL